ncbi:tRNA (cytidine(34)-2'-O)-methyltransferase [Pigmentiphaga humi]|uniref:tRNA (cytidine(34)-2'-O)-methyltransferase n=1 Tax=Pigmentiphaga humi TaxID=2478468 RepID=UPI000F5295D6|nr:tRNA (cytidine(34)-2'-O)-methyltransferase [Pigmentiphaga humi]
MFHVVLVSPEIPPNTGNAIRLAANTGVQLHLVRPLGFELDDAKLRRAGLDYHEWAAMKVHDGFADAIAATGAAPDRVFAFTTKGSRPFGTAAFLPGDVFVFGSETSGLPPAIRDAFPEAQRLRLPMRPGQRSLNLSNSVAVAVFEAWRQQGYAGGM